MMWEEKYGHLPLTKNLQMKHLNPGYWIKNKKKNELTEEETKKLFSKMEHLQFNEQGEIDVDAIEVVDDENDDLKNDIKKETSEGNSKEDYEVNKVVVTSSTSTSSKSKTTLT